MIKSVYENNLYRDMGPITNKKALNTSNKKKGSQLSTNE